VGLIIRHENELMKLKRIRKRSYNIALWASGDGEDLLFTAFSTSH
jgi:hypothetical protein